MINYDWEQNNPNRDKFHRPNPSNANPPKTQENFPLLVTLNPKPTTKTTNPKLKKNRKKKNQNKTLEPYKCKP